MAVVLGFSSLEANDTELFSCLFDICISSLRNCLFKSFIHFILGFCSLTEF